MEDPILHGEKKSMRFGIYYHCNRIVSFMIDQACLSLVFDAKYCSSRRRCLLCGQKLMHKYLVRTILLISIFLTQHLPHTHF
jgi:hypothetical protein